ncbi:MAG TPA: Fic family protein [Candidatus Angelobacter sp.]
MIYWPAFDFSYSLDMSRLLPHIAAIEAFRTAASLSLRPPQWREIPAAEGGEPALPLSAGNQQEITNEIQLRKERALLSNTGRDRAWVRQRFVPGCEPLSVEDILHMHRLVAEDTGIRYDSAGRFRREGLRVMVGTPQTGIHAGAPAEKLPHLMAQFVQLVNGRTLLSMIPAVHALVAHYFFTTIHPFDDGNGRVSRLVAAGILFWRGYSGHGYYALFNYFYHNEERYHRLVYQTQQKPCPDLTDFVAFGLEGLAVELQGINNFIKVRLQRTAEREILTPVLRERMGPRQKHNGDF